MKKQKADAVRIAAIAVIFMHFSAFLLAAAGFVLSIIANNIICAVLSLQVIALSAIGISCLLQIWEN